MGYVENSLGPGEQVAARGQLHWWVFIHGSVLAAIGMGLVLAGHAELALIGVVVTAVGLASFIGAYINQISTELAVTNRRVIAKFGFIRRRTVELNHAKVEGFHVDQGVLGRLLNFGTVTVTGTGGMQTPIPLIRDPLRFRALAMQQIDETQNHRP
jgi:uncharacterized membrane protein YdbT with pleckstrin-like domain